MADYEHLGEESPTRQQQINNLDVSESITISQRIDLSFGMDKDAVSRITKLLRGNLDQQANRARKGTGKDYTVENGSYLTSGGALIVCATITRLG